MNEIPPFKNPPIVEAILDLKTNLPKEVNLDTLASIQNEIKDDYPNKKERYQWQGNIQFQPGVTPQLAAPYGGIDGFLFNSQDMKKVVQARMDGFTFNQLKPYSSWNTFSLEAKKYWEYYLRLAKPLNVTRIALRYINRIEIPLPIKELKEYILTVPDVGQNIIPNVLENFFMQLILPNHEIKAKAIITETIGSDSPKGFLSLIFDIDVYKTGVWEPSDGIWEELNQLCRFKDSIFLNSISEKTKELFK